MAYGVQVKANITVADVDAEKLRKAVQKSLDDATGTNPIAVKNFTAKISKKAVTSIRSSIQQAVDAGTTQSPIQIKNFTAKMSAKDRNAITKQLKADFDGAGLVIKINKIDASKAVDNLRKQLTTMLGGLSITGLKEFLGADGVTEAYNKNTQAAEKLAQAQENVRKKTEGAKAALNSLSNMKLVANSMYKSLFGIDKQDVSSDLRNQIKDVFDQIEKARSLSGNEQMNLTAEIEKTVYELRKQVDLYKEEAKAIRSAGGEEAYKAEQAAKAAKEQEAAAKKTAREQERADKQAITLKGKLQKALQSNAQAYRDNADQIRKWSDELGDGSNVDIDNLNKIKKEFSEISSQVTTATIVSTSFFGQFTTMFDKVKGVFSTIKSMTWVVERFREMWQAVRDLDAAMTELKKVTDLTAQGYSNFLKEASATAKDIGASISDTVNATADFARLGFNVDEAQALAEAALVYKNVGDGITDISTATESLISTIKAFQDFGYAAEDAMFIVDKFNEVGNNFSISSSGIGEALRRSASALAAAGNDLDQSIGLITGMNSVVQDPDVVGTALKTVSMYLRAAKTDAEEAGISTDGMANSVAELRKELLALTGVDIMLDANTFKSTYEIMEDLSKVWSDLTDVSRANVLELIGGKRNGNVITSVLTNFDEAAAAMETAQDALGSASLENEKYLDSINGKLTILKASFEELSGAIINNQIAKIILDITTGFINFVTWLQKIGALLPIVVAGFSALKALKLADTFSTIARAIETMQTQGESASAIAKSVSSLINIMSGSQKTMLSSFLASSGALNGMTEEASDALLELLGLASTMDDAAISGATLADRLRSLKDASGVAFKGAAGKIAAAATALSLLIAAVNIGIEVYNHLTLSAEEAAEKINEVESAYASAQKSHASNISTLKSLRDEFAQLSSGVDENGDNVSLTAGEYERYCDIISQIAEISPDLVTGYDNERIHLNDYKGAIDNAIDSQNKFLENQENMLLGSSKEYMTKWKSDANDIQQQFQQGMSELGNALLGGSFKDADYWNGNYSEVAENIFRKFIPDFEMLGISLTDQENILRIIENQDIIYSALSQSGSYNSDQMIAIDSALRALASVDTGALEDLRDSVSNFFMMELRSGRVTQPIYEAIDSVGALDELRNGIFSVFDATADYDTNRDAIVAYAEDLSKLIDVAQRAGVMDTAKEFMEDGILSDKELARFNDIIADLETEFGENPAWDAALQFFNSLIGITKEGADGVDDLDTNVKGLSETLQSVSKAQSALENAQNDMSEYGSLTSDTVQTIAGMLGEQEKLTDYLYVQNGAIKLNEQAWKDRTEAMIQSDISGLRNQNTLLEQESQGYQAEINKALAYINKTAGYDPNLYTSSEAAQRAVDQYTEAILNNNKSIADNNNLIEINSTLLDKDGKSAIGASERFTNEQNAAQKAIDAIALWHQAQEEIEKSGRVSAETMLDAQGFWGQDWERYFSEDKSKMLEENVRGFVSTIMFMNGVDANLYDAIFAMFDNREGEDPTEQLFNDLEKLQKVASFVQKAREEIAEGGFVSVDTYMSAKDIFGDGWEKMFVDNANGEGLLIVEDNINSFVSTLMNAAGISGPLAETIMSLFANKPDTDGIEKLTDLLSDIKSGTNLISSIRDELSEDGTNSIDTLSSFISTYGDGWEEHVDFTNGIRISAQAVRDLAAEEIAAMEIKQEYKDELLKVVNASMLAEEANRSLKESYQGIKDTIKTVGSMERDSELSHDDYEALIAQDSRYAAAVHYQNGVMTISRDLFDEITEKIIAETQARAQQTIAMKMADERYQELIEKQKEYGLTAEELTELNGMEAEIMGWTALAQEIENANSALNRFINADNEAGASSYNHAVEAATMINDVLHNSKSEWYGRKGEEKFLEAKDLLIRPDIDMSVAEKSIKRYFSEDQAGIGNFVKDLVKFGFVDENNQLIGKDLDVIAQKLNLTTEAVRYLFAEYNTYADEAHQIKIAPEVDAGGAEEGTEKTNTLIEKAQTAQEAVHQVTEEADAAKTAVEAISNADLTIDITKAENSLQRILNKLITIANEIGAISNTKMNISASVNTGTTSTTGSGILSSIVSGLFGRSAAGGTMDASGGKTLVGELGREIVVDPYKNKWYTVGDNGAEFVNLPKNAIVFNAAQTGKLLSSGNVRGYGRAMASGTFDPTKIPGYFDTDEDTDFVDTRKQKVTINNDIDVISSAAPTTQQMLQAIGDVANGALDTNIGKNTSKKSSGGSSSSSKSSKEDEMTELEKLQEKYEQINSLTEHLIEHQEHLYNQAERGMDFSGMEDSLTEQARLYKQIMADSQKAVEDMRAAGGTDADEELQDMERAYWDAYESLYDTLDKINDLYVEGLNEKIDGIQDAFSTLQEAAKELSSDGAISTDTFQKLLDNGVQYMSLIEKVGDQYVINKEAVADLIKAEREQLAVETALSYLSQMQQALTDGNADALANLVNLNNQIGTSTWAAVYAQAELLKNLGLSDDQYQIIINNLNTMKDISQNVADDLSDQTSDLYKEQKEAIDYILKKTQELIKYETEERIDAIEEEIDGYKEIIALKKESLKASKEENEYQKSVAEKTQEIAKLQAKIDQLSLDDSREAAAKRAEYIEELNKLQGDLSDIQSDHATDLTETMLDKQAEEYETSRQEEIKQLEDRISSTEKVYQEAIARLNTGWDTIYQEIIAWNTEAGSTLNSEITENWQIALKAAQEYGSYVRALEAYESGNGVSLPVAVDKDLLPQYHTGGEVNGGKSKEVLALLEDSELVMTESAKNGLYKMVDFVQVLSERLGTAIKSVALASREARVDSLNAAIQSGTKPHSVSGGNNNTTFAPTVQVTFQHSGELTDQDAEKFGRKMADSAIGRFYNAFIVKGVGSTPGSRLRTT